MALRLMEVVVPVGAAPAVEGMLNDHPVEGVWREQLSDEQALVRILLSNRQIEPISDVLSQRFALAPGFRILVLPVEATLPEPQAEAAGVGPRRVSREELYQDIASGAELNPVFVATVILSALVATIGLIRSDVAIIIGAMVIAPLLSPNMALALSVNLGDWRLARTAVTSGSLAVVLALLFAIAVGGLLTVDPTVPEIVARTRVDAGHVALALAAGAVGALSFTSGVPAALIGVMVAVALLPPLATAGLLLGSGHWQAALGAALLYAINVTCLNLAAVVTFLLQGLRPRVWWQAEAARRATRFALIGWLLLFVTLGGLVVLYQGYLTTVAG